jgi:hypothetical protein
MQAQCLTCIQVNKEALIIPNFDSGSLKRDSQALQLLLPLLKMLSQEG